MSLLGHIVRGRATADFPDLEDWSGHCLGPSCRPPAATIDLSRVPLPTPISVSPPVTPPFDYCGQCHGPGLHLTTRRGGESKNWVRATQRSEHCSGIIVASNIIMMKAVAKHWKAAVAAQLKGARADTALLNNKTHYAVGCVSGLIARTTPDKTNFCRMAQKGAKDLIFCRGAPRQVLPGRGGHLMGEFRPSITLFLNTTYSRVFSSRMPMA